MSEADLHSRVRLAYAFADEIGLLFSERTFDSTEQNLAVAACKDLCFEHHGSVVVLIERRRFASAAALIRPMLDALVLAVGIDDGAVKPERIIGLLDGTLERPKLDDLINELAKRNNSLAPELKLFQKQALPVLHDYTHGGSRQITRRIRNGEIGSNTSSDEGLEMLSISNLIVMIASYVVLSKHAGEVEVEKLSGAYERVTQPE